MDDDLQLELVDLGDAKAQTRGPHTDPMGEEGPVRVYREM